LTYPQPHRMKRIHIAIATHDIAATVQDYAARLGCPPCVVVPGEYALWRTETINFSVRQDPDCRPGTLRHLGWEDATADTFATDVDCNGILWERFTMHHQASEIQSLWPQVRSAIAGIVDDDCGEMG